MADRLGKALKGPKWGDYWRYRCGDYRIIVDIQDDEVVILILRIGLNLTRAARSEVGAQPEEIRRGPGRRSWGYRRLLREGLPQAEAHIVGEGEEPGDCCSVRRGASHEKLSVAGETCLVPPSGKEHESVADTRHDAG